MNTIDDDVLALVVALAPGPTAGAGPVSALVGDLGYTSLRLLELLIAAETAFGLPPLGPEALAGVTTVAQFTDVVRTERDRL